MTHDEKILKLQDKLVEKKKNLGPLESYEMKTDCKQEIIPFFPININAYTLNQLHVTKAFLTTFLSNADVEIFQQSGFSYSALLEDIKYLIKKKEHASKKLEIQKTESILNGLLSKDAQTEKLLKEIEEQLV